MARETSTRAGLLVTWRLQSHAPAVNSPAPPSPPSCCSPALHPGCSLPAAPTATAVTRCCCCCGTISAAPGTRTPFTSPTAWLVLLFCRGRPDPFSAASPPAAAAPGSAPAARCARGAQVSAGSRLTVAGGQVVPWNPMYPQDRLIWVTCGRAGGSRAAAARAVVRRGGHAAAAPPGRRSAGAARADGERPLPRLGTRLQS
jgi:hypothetical protein